MSGFSLGAEAVYAVQRCSRELTESVWSVRFYEHLLDVLANNTWRDYATEAFGRRIHFERLTDFLIDPDGLGWPTVPEVLEMIAIVSKCSPPPPPRKNEPVDPPITEWARQALEKLKSCNVTQTAPSQRKSERMLALESPQFASGGENQYTLADYARDIVTARSQGDGGNSAAYLAARLKKADRDDLLSEIGPGKRFKSVRAAAIEAGIIRPVPTIRLVPDPAKVAAAIRKHLDQQQIASLVEELLR
jgi:hypothetical protein